MFSSISRRTLAQTRAFQTIDGAMKKSARFHAASARSRRWPTVFDPHCVCERSAPHRSASESEWSRRPAPSQSVVDPTSQSKPERSKQCLESMLVMVLRQLYSLGGVQYQQTARRKWCADKIQSKRPDWKQTKKEKRGEEK